jgi:hypothetical protein
MRTDRLCFLIFFVCMVGLGFIFIGYGVYDNYTPKETITTEIIDKWIDPNSGSALMFKVELADHRIYSIGSFEYQFLEFNKSYKMEVYKTFVRIIDERWRV